MSRPVPPKVAALIERGRQAVQAGDFQEAARAFERALQQMPELAAVQAMRAESLQLLGRADEAEHAWRQILRREPNNLAALEGMTHLCMGKQRLTELEEYARRGRAAAPSAPGFCLSLGYALWWQGRHDEALAAYHRGEELAAGSDPAFFHEAHLAQAMGLFRLGRWSEGWAHYAARQDRHALQGRYPRLALDPSSLLSATSMRIAIHSEQGIGDELFFLRFAPALRAKGHRLALRTHPKLLPLLQRRTDLFEDIAPVGTPVSCDVELQASDLALASGTSFADSLRFTPDAGRREALAARLRAFGPPPYIGVTWRAGLSREEGKQWGGLYWSKEIAPARLGEALRSVPGTIVIVQRKPEASDRAQLESAAGKAVLDMNEMNEDLLDAVALLSLLNEYVGVSNTNMHLLAATEGGAHANVVLPVAPEWRWAMEGDSPWFPGFRLYRAKQHEHLEGALVDLARDLRNSLTANK